MRVVPLGGNAAGLVLRLALKTRFSEMGWGSTPLPPAIIKHIKDQDREVRGIWQIKSTCLV